MRLPAALAVAALALVAAAPAVAQLPQGDDSPTDQPRPGRERDALRASPPTIMAEPVALLIAGFDADGDARVTRAEFDAGVARAWAAADPAGAGAIGYIAFGDWSAIWIGDRNALPSPFETDRDGDNRITRAEFAERMARFFDRFDADKDGAIVRRELLTIQQTLFGPGRGGRDGMRPPRRPQ